MPAPADQRPAPLSDGEATVARLVASGHSNAEIATARCVSPGTVANQLAEVYRKLGVASRVELALFLDRDAA